MYCRGWYHSSLGNTKIELKLKWKKNTKTHLNHGQINHDKICSDETLIHVDVSLVII